MAKVCKHRNGELIEFMTATHSRDFRDGILDPVGYNEIGNVDGYEFHCLDCDRWFKFRFKKSPKWFREIYRQLRETD